MSKPSEELGEIVDRLARFFFLAKRYGTALHADVDISTGERALLLEIEQEGPRTVPEMADRRGLSRQAIQKTVDLLASRHWVEKRVTPNDRRGRSVHLTRRGSALIKKLKSRELSEALAIKNDIPIGDLRRTNDFMDWLESYLIDRLSELGEERNER